MCELPPWGSLKCHIFYIILHSENQTCMCRVGDMKCCFHTSAESGNFLQNSVLTGMPTCMICDITTNLEFKSDPIFN